VVEKIFFSEKLERNIGKNGRVNCGINFWNITISNKHRPKLQFYSAETTHKELHLVPKMRFYPITTKTKACGL
jgi:hypothetical protein